MTPSPSAKHHGGSAPAPRPAYLRLAGAAAYLSMSVPNLQRLHRAGIGPPRINKGRAVFYSIKALDAWMEQDQVEPNRLSAA